LEWKKEQKPALFPWPKPVYHVHQLLLQPHSLMGLCG
jgi:hypothetical protein